MSRFEPENNAHLFVEAYEKVKTEMPLMMVGHAPYGKSYVEKLRSTQDPRIRFIGPAYGGDYRVLLSHAFLYFHGNEVGGTNPALLEAMATGNCVIANGVEFNREVVGDAGVCFKYGDVDDLKRKIDHFMAHRGEVERYRPMAVERMKKYYSWDAIADQYHEFFQSLNGSSGEPPVRYRFTKEQVSNAMKQLEAGVPASKICRYLGIVCENCYWDRHTAPGTFRCSNLLWAQSLRKGNTP